MDLRGEGSSVSGMAAVQGGRRDHQAPWLSGAQRASAGGTWTVQYPLLVFMFVMVPCATGRWFMT